MDDRTAWHEDEVLWETVRDFVFPPEAIEEATDQIERLLDLVDLDANAAILDVPCGVGRHAVELAERGFRVTAVDATEPYLDAARERASGAAAAVEVERADMREFRRDGTFDAVFNLYTSFGYFEDRADDERTARNFHASLTPGGVLVMDLVCKEILAREFTERTWEERDGTFLLEEHRIEDDWSWIDNRWIVASDEGIREFTVSHRLYSAFELRELLTGVGFDEVEVYGGFDGSDFDETAERLVVVARK